MYIDVGLLTDVWGGGGCVGDYSTFSGLDYSIVFGSVFRAIATNPNISHTASINTEQPCSSLRIAIKYIPTWCSIGAHAILFIEREETALRITGNTHGL